MSENKVKRYKRISEYFDKITASRKETGSRGRFSGFKSLEPYISFIPGHQTTIFGTAGSGKTAFGVECCINMAEVYGSKTVFYLTEVGTWSETVLDICQTYLGKTLDVMTDEELLDALTWMDEHFFVLDISKGLMSIRDIYEQVLEMQKEYDIKIDNILIDHFGNVVPDPSVKGTGLHNEVKFTFQAITATSKLKNFHTIILFHVANQDPIKCPQSGKFYLPKAEPYMLSGGVQSHFLSQQMISVYRPISRQEQYGVVNPETGVPFEVNEAHITCMKVKPKFSGSLGGAVLHFDVKSQRYYEVNNGIKQYREGVLDRKKKPSIDDSAIKPNLNFGTELESAPF